MARLFRVIELFAQNRLKEHYGIDTRLNLLPEVMRKPTGRTSTPTRSPIDTGLIQQKVSSIMAVAMRSPKPYQQMRGLGCSYRQIPPWVLRPGEKPFRKEEAPPPPSSTTTVPPGIDPRPPPGAPQEQPPIGAGSQEALESGRSSGRTVDGAEGGPPGGAGGPLAVQGGHRPSTCLQLPDGRMIRDLGDGTFRMVTGAGFAEQNDINKQISAATMEEIDASEALA